jgi:hypothetical protein
MRKMMTRLAAATCLALWCLAIATLLTFPLSAQTPHSGQSLYGTWYVYPRGNPNTDPLRHQFRHNASTGKDEMIVTRLCPGDYRAVIARVVVPVEISTTSIKIPKSESDTEKVDLNSVCQVGVVAGTMSYTMADTGDQVSITYPGGTPDTFQLVRQDAASEAILPASLYGTWSFPLMMDNGAAVQIKLVFYNSGDSDRGMVRQIATCSKANTKLLSQVDSPIRIVKDQISILKTASHEQQDGPFSCKATITAGTLRFSVSSNGATMSLTKGGERPLVLTRDTSRD